MNIGWPEGILLAMVALSVLINAAKDRDPKTGIGAIYHFPATVCNQAILLALL